MMYGTLSAQFEASSLSPRWKDPKPKGLHARRRFKPKFKPKFKSPRRRRFPHPKR